MSRNDSCPSGTIRPRPIVLHNALTDKITLLEARRGFLLGESIAGISETVEAFDGREVVESDADRIPGAIDGPSSDFSQLVFELGEHRFDRVEIRAKPFNCFQPFPCIFCLKKSRCFS